MPHKAIVLLHIFAYFHHHQPPSSICRKNNVENENIKKKMKTHIEVWKKEYL